MPVPWLWESCGIRLDDSYLMRGVSGEIAWLCPGLKKTPWSLVRSRFDLNSSDTTSNCQVLISSELLYSVRTAATGLSNVANKSPWGGKGSILTFSVGIKQNKICGKCT